MFEKGASAPLVMLGRKGGEGRRLAAWEQSTHAMRRELLRIGEEVGPRQHVMVHNERM